MLGNCTIHDRTAQDEITKRASKAEILLTNKVPVSAELIKRLPKLRYIGVLATGYNIVDTAAAKTAGITVTNIPAYSTMSVAQHTIALMIYLASMLVIYLLGLSPKVIRLFVRLGKMGKTSKPAQ